MAPQLNTESCCALNKREERFEPQRPFRVLKMFEEKANHQEEVAGEDISAFERRRHEQARGAWGHAPSGNFEN